MIVLHRKTGRAFSCDEHYKVVEPLIFDLIAFTYKTVREYWKPMMPDTPMWAAGIRDLEFDTFFVR